MNPPDREGDDAGLQRLPPGRHGLSREFVTRNQRDRLTAGMIATVAAHGYHETTISEVAAAAGVSRRTFYSYFDSKEACFLDTFGLIEDHLVEVMTDAGTTIRAWPARAKAQLSVMLEELAANPDLVRFALIAPPAAGGRFLERYRAFLERLIGVVAGDRVPRSKVANEGAELAMAGGLAALITAKVNAGEGERLLELLPELTELVLTPYIGHKRAAKEARG
ncbi:MAG TPA: helix-turn-helix domain-containing protein [Solirubrobacterales bacterium]|nr:helix-turn-helix domain-containing protein [Solirubrobacterales bacterium]